jgi:peptidoglycan/LPS O-acetylase OafA/YrhL
MAAMGVLWIHSWTKLGNPRCVIGKIDLADFLAIGGNGVDLFFVISGFCMYYFYASKTEFSYHDFYRFIVKRWVRLSPAFYASTIIYILVREIVYHDHLNTLRNFLHSVFYLNYFFVQFNTASHFWTLTVEWQFYFTIPFLLIYQNKIGFKRIFLIIFSIFFLAALCSVFILKEQSDVLTQTFIFRAPEFGFGAVAARLLMKNDAFFKKRIFWLFASIVVVYVGRVLISKPALALSQYYYNLFKLAGFTLMGLGFACILYLSVTSTKWLNLFLGNKLFRTMGRISYSFYLLHALIFPLVVGFIIEFMPFAKGIAAPLITTAISAVILYPVSQFSYNWLERPFLSIGNLTNK